MYKAGESIRSVEDVATVAVQATGHLYLLCARVKPFFAVEWRWWRGACDGSWGRACGMVDGSTQHHRGAQSDERGADGTAWPVDTSHLQVLTRPGPADRQGGSWFAIV